MQRHLQTNNKIISRLRDRPKLFLYFVYNFDFQRRWNLEYGVLISFLYFLALYGVLFVGEETTGGFSNYRLWESVGFIIAYILQTQVCIDVKLWILLATLVLGLAGYLTVELKT